MTEEPVTAALRALREDAGVGVREMARRLGVSPNSYSHYENPERFKDTYLPMTWALRFADALEKSGVDRARVVALAGVTDPDPGLGVDARVARLSSRRRSMLLELLSDLEAAEIADQEHPKISDGDEGTEP